MSTRVEVPLPGPSLTFHEWTELLTVELRRFIPDVRAARGPGRVVWRYGDREVWCDNDREIFLIRYEMVSLCDRERHDALTARNFAKSIAGYFDARHSLPD